MVSLGHPSNLRRFLSCGEALDSALANPLVLKATFLLLFSVILGSALSVVRHAEHLAVRLGEPFGTLILTLSVTFIEVMSISAIMLHGENNPTLVRNTLLSVIMIVLNGMVGLSLLLGDGNTWTKPTIFRAPTPISELSFRWRCGAAAISRWGARR